MLNLPQNKCGLLSDSGRRNSSVSNKSSRKQKHFTTTTPTTTTTMMQTALTRYLTKNHFTYYN